MMPRGFRDARVVSDPRDALPSPERHAADLACHACITYRRPVDSRARQPSPAGQRGCALESHDAAGFISLSEEANCFRVLLSLGSWGRLLGKINEACCNVPLRRLVDDDCTAAVLVKADARPGHPLGGEGRRQGRWAQPGAA